MANKKVASEGLEPGYCTLFRREARQVPVNTRRVPPCGKPASVFRQYVEDSNQAERSSGRQMARRSRNSVQCAG